MLFAGVSSDRSPILKIIVGDIMQFNAHLAATVSCDGLLLSGEGVKVDESAITGEPEPVAKDVQQSPFMFSGTSVCAGAGTMLVVAVGENSVAGKINQAVYEVKVEKHSPLYQKVDALAELIGRCGQMCAALFFIVQIVHGATNKTWTKDWTKLIGYVTQSLGLLAVAVPEGLPLSQTITLAFCSGKMIHENNLVKVLESCETMGSVTTICTDKTGTLTENRMTVRGGCFGNEYFPVRSAIGEALRELLCHHVSVCTMDESQIRRELGDFGQVRTTFSGNPTDCALLEFAEGLGMSYRDIRAKTIGRAKGTLSEGKLNAFSSARQIMSWAVKNDNGYRVYVKGASEVILSRSVHEYDAGSNSQTRISAESRANLDNHVIGFAKQAMRTIGLAYKDVQVLPAGEISSVVFNNDGSAALDCETDLTLIGVIAIEDPLRPEVPPAIEKCTTAGIDVRMVTGDNLTTAVAVAKNAGIIDAQRDCDDQGNIHCGVAMLGKDFRDKVHVHGVFHQAEFDKIWPYLRVLARSSPEDKVTLATGLKSSKLYQDSHALRQLKGCVTVFPDQQVVAMTGDGTNDAPALKAADVGFSMNKAGTQIAKDAADVILLDDNFATIVQAAKWGRNVTDCVQKFVQFQLTVNVTICSVLLLTALHPGAVEDTPDGPSRKRFEPPLTILQMLWLNLIMDSLGAIALASEKPTDDMLTRPPVNRSDSIITPQMYVNIFGQMVYQVTVILVYLFYPSVLPGLLECGTDCADAAVKVKCMDDNQKQQYSLIFNSFVFMTFANQINCRKLRGERNVFSGIGSNPNFLIVMFATSMVQILIVEFFGDTMNVFPHGVSRTQWVCSFLSAAGALVWQQVLNTFIRCEEAGSRFAKSKAKSLGGRKRSEFSIEHNGLKKRRRVEEGEAGRR